MLLASLSPPALHRRAPGPEWPGPFLHKNVYGETCSTNSNVPLFVPPHGGYWNEAQIAIASETFCGVSNNNVDLSHSNKTVIYRQQNRFSSSSSDKVTFQTISNHGERRKQEILEMRVVRPWRFDRSLPTIYLCLRSLRRIYHALK
jgi:hypothetical protein